MTSSTAPAPGGIPAAAAVLAATSKYVTADDTDPNWDKQWKLFDNLYFYRYNFNKTDEYIKDIVVPNVNTNLEKYGEWEEFRICGPALSFNPEAGRGLSGIPAAGSIDEAASPEGYDLYPNGARSQYRKLNVDQLRQLAFDCRENGMTLENNLTYKLYMCGNDIKKKCGSIDSAQTSWRNRKLDKIVLEIISYLLMFPRAMVCRREISW